jgi:hypothetical protein
MLMWSLVRSPCHACIAGSAWSCPHHPLSLTPCSSQLCRCALLPLVGAAGLPVQIEAANSLKFLIESCDESEAALLPMLPSMLNQYFAIMQEIGNDLVVQASGVHMCVCIEVYCTAQCECRLQTDTMD